MECHFCRFFLGFWKGITITRCGEKSILSPQMVVVSLLLSITPGSDHTSLTRILHPPLLDKRYNKFQTSTKSAADTVSNAVAGLLFAHNVCFWRTNRHKRCCHLQKNFKALEHLPLSAGRSLWPLTTKHQQKGVIGLFSNIPKIGLFHTMAGFSHAFMMESEKLKIW